VIDGRVREAEDPTHNPAAGSSVRDPVSDALSRCHASSLMPLTSSLQPSHHELATASAAPPVSQRVGRALCLAPRV
jgi:hypothetical protein